MTLFLLNFLICVSIDGDVCCRSIVGGGGFCFHDHERPFVIILSIADPFQDARYLKSLPPTGTRGKSFSLITSSIGSCISVLVVIRVSLLLGFLLCFVPFW